MSLTVINSARAKTGTWKNSGVKPMAKDVKEMLGDLARLGGAIVSSNECTDFEVAQTAACGRFYVNEADALGFVRRPKEWLQEIKKLQGIPAQRVHK
jgi:hypothetical protein